MLLSVLAHHPESGDPQLLEWIKNQLDAMIGLGPWMVVALLALFMVSIPACVMFVYMMQRRRGGYRQR